MAKKTIKERAQDYLERNEAKEVFATSDGFLFVSDAFAKVHAKGLEDKKITKFATSAEKTKAEELSELNAADSIALIKEATEVADIEVFAEDDRKTVKKAYDERIEELTKEAE